MKIYLIRHGYTLGNEERRYVGETDEPLSELGRSELESRSAKCQEIHPDVILVSPMIRCMQTAEILFPQNTYRKVEDFRECSFGKFEYKNYEELNGDLDYQKWIDSGGTIAFPGGETPDAFRTRCQNAFFHEIGQFEDDQPGTVVLVVHGGTIMSIMDAISSPHQDYFAWQVSNGKGFVGQYHMEEKTLRGIEKLF